MIVRYLIILLQVSHSDFSSLCIESLGTYIACYHDRYFLSVCDCHLSSNVGQSFLWVPAIRSWSAPGEPSYGAAIPMLQLLPSLSWPVWFTMCIEVLHSNRIKYSLRINFSALLIQLQVFGGLTFLGDKSCSFSVVSKFTEIAEHTYLYCIYQEDSSIFNLQEIFVNVSK